MIRALTLAGLFLAVLAAPAAPLGSGGGPPALPRDDLRGRWMLFESFPVDPVVFLSGTTRFFAINQPGSRLIEYAQGSSQKLQEIPIGLGAVSLARRPDAQEIWVVDQLGASVSVLRRSNGRTLRTIRVGAEPTGIVFSASGDRAYVSCSAIDAVDVIDTATYRVVNRIPIPAKNPRCIARVGDTVYVLPFLSGNGSAPRGNDQTGDSEDVVELAYPSDFPGAQPLPDRDLFAIPIGPSPATDTLDPAGTVHGLGTVLYSLRHRPGTNELWVPNTEALNALFKGEKSFVGGQVVSNRISVVSLAPGGNALARTIDLDALAPAPHLRCATPTDVAFTSDGSRAFVCGYGSDSIAVLDATSDPAIWLGIIRIVRTGNYPDGVGPRRLSVDPSGSWLLAFNKGDNSLSRIEIAQLPATPGFVWTAPPSVSLGWDPTPADLVQGRIHFIRTANSKSHTSSCFSCHVDGHTDGMAWDLGVFLDPESTPSAQLAFPLDAKGPMVTQSLRHLKEVGPYHWRGERKRLVDFNQTFITLLDREENGVPAHLTGRFRYITQYMEHLGLPPNPRQAADRGLRPSETAGADLFLDHPSLNGRSCASCHVLPLGTAGDIADNLGGGHSPASVVSALRGVADKLSPPFDVGASFGRRTELGAGLGHGGALGSLTDLLLQALPPPQSGQRFDLTPQQADAIAAFLEVFDTGLAPAAAWQVTAHAGNAANFLQDELQFLLDQAAAGHCDVVFRYGPELFAGAQRFPGGAYEPSSGRFRQASTSLPLLTPATLIEKAQGGVPVTFYGVPTLMGHSFGLDRDNDKLLDLDELLLGTDPELEDTDEDGFPDGYELRLGMNPLAPDASSPDTEPAELRGPVRILNITTNSAKLEFETSEETRILFSYNGGGPVLRAPLKPRFDDSFSEILSELEPGTYYQVRLRMEDLNRNFSDAYAGFYTRSLGTPALARIEDIGIAALGARAGPGWLRAGLTLGFGGGAPAPGYQVRTSVYYVADDESTLVEIEQAVRITGADGRIEFDLAVPPQIPRGAGNLHLVVREVSPPPGGAVHARGEDRAGNAARARY